jgi:hypothetical protein
MIQSNPYAPFIKEGAVVWFASQDAKRQYQKGRIYKIDKLNNTVTIRESLETSSPQLTQKPLVVPMEYLEECADESTFSFFSTTMNLVNKPEILNYIYWVFKNESQYFYMDHSIFFLKHHKQSSPPPIYPEKYLDSINTFNNDVFKSQANFYDFLVSAFISMKKDQKNKTIFLIGQNASGKSLHAQYFSNFIQEMFLKRNKIFAEKVKAAWSIIRIVTSSLAPDGHEDSFAFAQLRYLFDEHLNLTSVNFRLISCFITFITSEKNVEKMPILFYLTKFFMEENKMPTDHFSIIFNIDKTETIRNGFEIYRSLFLELTRAFEVL